MSEAEQNTLERIQQAAMEEFLAKGFVNANLKL